MVLLVTLLFLPFGCGRSIDCSNAGSSLAMAGDQQLACHEASWAIGYIAVLAGRPVPRGDRRLVLREVRDRFEADPVGTRAWLSELRAAGATLSATPASSPSGFPGSENRATQVYAAQAGTGLITSDHGEVWSVQKRTMAVWSVDDDQRLAITEADIEAWIRYASLCREVQQGGPLRVSVADRLNVYRMVRERFEDGSRGEQVAVSSMGAVWPSVLDAWQAASFDEQQAFISNAPLPGPMTATSLAYAEAVFSEDVVAHAMALQGAIGPLTVGRSGPMFSAEVPDP